MQVKAIPFHETDRSSVERKKHSAHERQAFWVHKPLATSGGVSRQVTETHACSLGFERQIAINVRLGSIAASQTS